MSVTPIEIPILVWMAGGSEPARLARALASAGVEVRSLDDDGPIPASFVILDSSAECARLRALAYGDRITIAFVGADQAAALEAGADLVWPPGVSDVVVLSAVRRTAARERSLIDSVPHAIFVVATDGRIRVANAGVQAMLGRPSSDLVGRSLVELVVDEDVDLVASLIEDAAPAGAVAAPTVVRARRHDQSLVEIELSARNMIDEPSIRGVLVDAREASDRMSVGAALQESEMRFGAIFENLLDGLVQIDQASRRLVKANPAFCRITGYAPHEISRLTLLDLVPSEDRLEASDVLDRHFRGERHVTESLRIQHKDRSPLYVDLGTTRMELSGVRCMLAVVRDVTARRETERTRELFLAIVAHELRTPVAVLQNSVELLRAQPPPSPSDREVIVHVLHDEVGRLGRLVADALDVGAIQAGTLTLKPLRVELAPLVASVLGRVAPQFDGHANLHIEDVDAVVDPLRFEQIVTNLVDNAWRHGGEREIDVSLSAVNGHAQLTVLDRGPGLPKEIRGSAFERVLLPNDRPTAGIGVGLWLVKRLARRMGGTIEASPGEGGRGMRVIVTFPIAASEESAFSATR